MDKPADSKFVIGQYVRWFREQAFYSIGRIISNGRPFASYRGDRSYILVRWIRESPMDTWVPSEELQPLDPDDELMLILSQAGE